ncbi:MAG: DUF2784 family protein, partial [Terriglobia bacterium]
IEVSNLPCPLTIAEMFLEARGGITPFREPFLLHYLEAFVYPNVPLGALIIGAVVVCVAILATYWRRYRHRDARGW